MGVIKYIYLTDSKAQKKIMFKVTLSEDIWQKALLTWVAVFKTGPSVGMLFDWNPWNLQFSLI